MSQYTLNPHALLREYATRFVRDYGFVLIPMTEGRGSNAPAIKWKIDGPNKDALSKRLTVGGLHRKMCTTNIRHGTGSQLPAVRRGLLRLTLTPNMKNTGRSAGI